MGYWAIFAVSFAIALSGALAPGPLLAATIYSSARQGFRSGPLLILGHAVSEMLMVALLIFGFSRFIHSAALLRTISIAGALILFVFGLQMLASLKTVSLHTPQGEETSRSLIVKGFTLSLANPYWTVWWLTAGLGLLLGARQQGYLAVLVFFLGHILADLGWYSLISLTVSRGKRLISEGVYRGSVAVCGLLLMGFGVWFAATSLYPPLKGQ